MTEYGKSEFHVTLKNGKPFLQHLFDGSLCDEMKIYEINKEPYVKRFSTKFYLTEEMLNELKAAC